MMNAILGTVALVAMGAWAWAAFAMACGKRRADHDGQDTDELAAMRRRVETRRAALAAHVRDAG